MQLAKVVGTVVATQKEPSLEGLKLLLVRPVDAEGRETGGTWSRPTRSGRASARWCSIASGSSARQTRPPTIGRWTR